MTSSDIKLIKNSVTNRSEDIMVPLVCYLSKVRIIPKQDENKLAGTMQILKYIIDKDYD